MSTELKQKRFFRPSFRSFTGQILIIMAIGVASAQLISSTIWVRQLASDTEIHVKEVSQHMAFRIAATISYFESLPTNYRHIVIDQLRDMGGTRFFVTLNKEEILITDLPDTHLKSIVKHEVQTTLEKQLSIHNAKIRFSNPSNLHVINNQTKLTDLPERWGHHSLLVKPLTTPIIVIQIPINDTDWLYLASLMPDPNFLEDTTPLSGERLFSMAISVITVLLLSLLILRRVTRPLASLAHAAEQFGQGNLQTIPETGSVEVQKTAKAFNDMQSRIQRYLNDRERLFSSISHDLKTPLTRLHLRAEMLDDDDVRESIIRDLDDLDMLVKGALQSVKDTDIHENIVEVNISRMLNDMQSGLNLQNERLIVVGQLIHPFIGKPLAVKRCLGNLIDNALYYGKSATVYVEDHEDGLTIRVCDKGPGIPNDKMDKVFQPYTRLIPDHSGHPGGMGLGLSIARNIARAQGGEVTLTNTQGIGLEAKIWLPRH
ncbi:ATP-binding protein [Marinomonas sp.]|nr:ATP-binding protein [Marinomonas sp.]MDB4837551.1 ATP-binding protein [Marinomonas sp.]